MRQQGYSVPMLITNQLFEAFVRCKFKAHLLARGESGVISEYERITDRLDQDYLDKALAKSRHEGGALVLNDISLLQALNEPSRLFVNACVMNERFSVRIEAIERLADERSGEPPAIIPLLFLHREKINRFDRLRLAFQAHVLTEVLGIQCSIGKIIHGHNFTSMRVNLVKNDGTTAIAMDGRRLMNDLAAQIDSSLIR